ncbi:MAG TPA: PEGA domain-containing protein [Candidatus Sulfotelmatobacter sp.]|nr:PEGA domain-containing protein [Candidatus Sulfotelmatobacter sp.]
MSLRPTARLWYVILAMLAFLLPPVLLAGGNQVMGELRLQGKTKVERTSGVWIDGQYVGYLKELKGNKRVLLLPGEHVVSVRQNGYQDFTQRVVLRPGQKLTVEVAMQKAATGAEPASWSTVKIDVNPPRAAVFLDGSFVGHVAEFEGLGRALLVAPGTHNIKITLPGYKTFETEINPLAHQKVELKTTLLKSDVPNNDPSLQGNGSENSDHLAPPPPSSSRQPFPQPPPPQRDPDRAPPPPPDPNPQGA